MAEHTHSTPASAVRTDRRGFLAFVGGLTLTGTVQRQASAKTPTLILPDSVPPQMPITADLRYPLLAACGTETCALIKVRQLTPQDEFREWLESGLRVARLYNGRSEAELESLLRSGVPMSAIRGDWA